MAKKKKRGETFVGRENPLNFISYSYVDYLSLIDITIEYQRGNYFPQQ